MALINRMSRLLSADIHALLDRIEEPEALLKQAIREMEEQLARGEDYTLRLAAEQDELHGRRKKADAAIAALDARLGIALDAGNETIARRLVRRKLETARFAERLAERAETLDTKLGRVRALRAEQSERLAVLRQRAEVLLDPVSFGDDGPRDDLGRDGFGREGFGVTDDEVEIELLGERQRRQRS
jgi:phage shock protein A